MYSDKDLTILREQLGCMIAFMEDTHDPENPHRGAWWWSGDVPAHPELYDPYDWETHNRAIVHVWGEHLYELRKAGLTENLEAAERLEIADLLACSDVYTKS